VAGDEAKIADITRGVAIPGRAVAGATGDDHRPQLPQRQPRDARDPADQREPGATMAAGAFDVMTGWQTGRDDCSTA
jgi:hypothetical protein